MLQCIHILSAVSVYAPMLPTEFRQLVRENKWKLMTAGVCPSHLHSSVTILPKTYATDFLGFCALNQKPLPIVEVLAPGSWVPSGIAQNADIRSDLAAYEIFKDGMLTSVSNDISDLWQDDFVTFFIGCSYTFEQALVDAGIPLRHLEQGTEVSVYRTNIPCRPFGIFHGNMVVSMRPMTMDNAKRAFHISAPFSWAHGAPVHAGDPKLIGIEDVMKPEWGEPVPIEHDEIPVFWACGNTNREAIENAKLPLVITDSGKMFITDVKATEYDKLALNLLKGAIIT